MNLAKYQKEAIVRAIKHDTPFKYTIDDVRKMAYKAMSKRCQSLYRDNPQALRTATLYVQDRTYHDVPVGDAPKTWNKDFVDYVNQRSEAFRKLEAAVNGCQTRKQFINTFPEFSNYAPSEHDKCNTLPAVANVAAELVQLGWKQVVSKG